MSSTPFQLHVWPHRLLVVGPAHASGAHRHHAAQIACGLDGPVAYRCAEGGVQRGDVVLIPPDVVHSHEAFGAAAVLYLDAESAEWRGFPGGDAAGLAALPFDAGLRTLARQATGPDAQAAQAFADRLLGTTAPAPAHEDELVAQVRDLIHARLEGAVTLASLATAVHRSPSRLAHRFSLATGLPLRRYVLWCRLRAAAEAAMRGASLTEAAHVAGFADSAHLSRTFRATFGIAPSLLFERGRFTVVFYDASSSRSIAKVPADS